MGSYNRTTWTDGASPGLNAAHLQRYEDTLAGLDNRVSAFHPTRMAGDAIQSIAVPAYIYPDWYTAGGGVWARMWSNSPYVAFAVVNPNSGPGAAVNTDYQTGITRATASGLRILGYVDTNYAAVTAATAKTDIDNWYAWYGGNGLAGIFLDRGASAAANQAYYADLYAYIKAKDPTAIVVLNPGIPNVDESYMQACDVLLNAEGDPTTYNGLTFPSWVANYPSRRFWHAIYSVPDTTTRDSLLTTTKTNRGGYVMLTTGDSTWTSLPADPFWSGLVAAVK